MIGFRGPPERSPERDEALRAALAHVPTRGWGWPALAEALAERGMSAEAARMEAELLFPGGAVEMVETFIDLADRDMGEIAAEPGFEELRTTAKVRRLVLGRLEALGPHREAVRRAFAVLANPRHACLGPATLARTADEIWVLAGDQATDFSRYTKRALLAGVYSATLLFWLRDNSEGFANTAAFLDRSLAGVGRIGKLRGEVEARLAGLRRAG